jgi:DMSO reductase anchor subunit
MELQWPLILFTTLVAWSAGVFGAQAVLALKGEGREIQVPAVVTSVVLLALSGIAVFFHLQHWERIFNGFGHITSGITQELIAIVAFVVVAVVYFAMLRRSEDGGTVPKWLAVVAIAISAILALVCAHSYMMAARPAWDTVAWPLVELCEGAALGALTVMAMLAMKGDGSAASSKLGGLAAIVGAAASAVLTVALVAVWQASAGSFADVGYHFDPTSPTSPLVDVAAETNVLSGGLAPVVWLGVVVAGAVLPVVAAVLGKRQADAGKPRSWLALGAAGVACLLVGAICLRVVFYELGFSVFMFY